MVKPVRDQNIKVFVRCRPLNNIEKSQRGIHTIVETPPSQKEIIVKERINERLAKTFTFDKVFGQSSSQMDVYNAVARPLLEEVLLGYNCTLFAYGQTGTGKTFTMEGERTEGNYQSWEADPLCGIIPRVMSQLFDELQMQRVEFTVRVSLVELYNEELFDLLGAADEGGRLRLYDDPTRKGSVVIQGMEEVTVQNKFEVYDILAKGSQRRQTAATLMNDKSSRSHTVFSVTVHIKENTVDGEELLKTGKLNLVDLAGSENISRSGAVEKRAREAGNINQSLLTLGRVITSLVERTPHIPYRESKLTRILQDSLGGRTKTSIIATVSPASSNLEETLSTLEYANRAKNIKNQPEVNQKLSKATLIKQYTEEIEKLRRDLVASRERNGIYLAQENYLQLMQQIEYAEKDNLSKMENICALKETLENQQKLFDEVKLSLANTERDLNEKIEDLDKTKLKLDKTKQTLKEEKYKSKETEFLLEKVRETEESLTIEATALYTTVTTSTTDLEGVHTKLDRKRSVEQENKRKADSFASTASEKLSSLVQEFHCNTQRSKERQECVSRDAEMLINTSEEAYNEAVETLWSHLAEDQKSHLKIVKELFEKQGTLYLDYLKENLNFSRNCYDDNVAILEQYVKDVTVGMNTLIENQSKQEEEMKNLSDDVLLKADHFKAERERRLDEYTSYLNSSEREIFAMIEEQKEDLLKYSQCVDDDKESTDQFTENLQNEVASVIEKLMKVQSQTQQYLETKSQRHQSLKETQNRISDRLGVREKSIQEMCQRGLLTAQHENTATSELKATLEESTGKLHQSLDDMNLAVNQHEREFTAKASDFAENRRKALQDVVKHVKHENDEGERKWTASMTEFEDLTQKMESLLVTSASKCQSVMEQWKSSCCAIGEGTKQILDENIKEEWSREHAGKLEMQRESIWRFCKEELKDDVPTGTTPQRRTWNYPQTLTATSPLERLKQRFRQSNSVDMSSSFSEESTCLCDDGSITPDDTCLSDSEIKLKSPSDDGLGFKRSASTSDIAQKTGMSTNSSLPVPRRKLEDSKKENEFLAPKLLSSTKKLGGSESNLKKSGTDRKPKTVRVLTPLNK